MVNLRSLLILAACYIGITFLAGRPLLPVPPHLLYIYMGLMAFFAVMSCLPSKWGNVIQVTESGLTLIKDGLTRQTIDWLGIETLKTNKRMISLVLKPGNKPRGVVIGKEGFSVDAWERLKEAVLSNFSAKKGL